jgi:8-amino-7-oxononanoate synthase
VTPFLKQLAAEIADMKNADGLRRCPMTAGLHRSHLTVAGRATLSFATNDYLGLSGHPALATAAAAAIATDGAGASASRLLGGSLQAVSELESDLARFLGVPAVLVFPSGYQANIGALTALAGRGDLIVSDALNHASLIDGCRLSRAEIVTYPHLDVAAASVALRRAPAYRRSLLVTESLFSMDGDVAPVGELAALAAAAGAVFMVDEAHAFGVLGPTGRGVCAAAGVVPDVFIGTLGKALAAGGGFVAGPSLLRELLVNRARTFIYTTALAPPLAGAASAALSLAAGDEGENRRAAVRRHRDRLLAAVAHWIRPPPTLQGPIVPIVIGDNAQAVRAAAELDALGIFAPAIRPPTVPPGTARLRISLSAGHTDRDIDALATALVSVLRT